MPYALKKPCAQPGCPLLVAAGTHRCPQHAREQRRFNDANRPSASDRGYDSEWRTYRGRYLQEHRYCVDPYKLHGGLRVLATHVDHIQRVSGPSDPLFWQASNHRALCSACHRSKTARVDGALGNPVR